MPEINAVRSGRLQPLVRTALAIAGIALTTLLAPARLQSQACTTAALRDIGKIEGQGGTLSAVIKVVSGKRTVPGSADPLMLRYYEGYNQFNPNQKWPTTGAAVPGPTLRTGATDKVNITFLNQVDVEQFGGSLDSGEKGKGTGCDESRSLNADGTINVANFYPANDKYPNCFHGSSSANLHFHGAHVTPATTGDNVLINVRPNMKVTEKDVKASFAKIFEHCALNHEPQKWEDLPQEYRDLQEGLLNEYDKTAPYVGPFANPDGHGLPSGPPPADKPDLRLWSKNEKAIARGAWPQWYIGAYPYCFQFPEYGAANPDIRMGQAPGTHWYHSHKHGSTSLNLFNGLAGAMILTDESPTGYDGKLQAFYGGKPNPTEKVLVLQQYSEAINLTTPTGGGSNPSQVLVNGQLTPTITMKRGEVQLWRIVNASVLVFVKASEFQPAGGITFRQTAQDGVQLDWKNYINPNNGKGKISMSPANRIDLLVQAPAAAGCFTLQDEVLGTILYVNVIQDSVPAKGFPTQEKDYPALPKFLWDIDKDEAARHKREITYGSTPPDSNPPAGTNSLRQFNINGFQFADRKIDELIKVDTAEEWTLFSTDDLTIFPRKKRIVGHPFHIHVNPFQVFEIFDPTTMTTPLTLPPPYVWWDTFAIPLARLESDPKKCPVPLKQNGAKVLVCPGYFKMRTRFVDFTGEFVEHCHILGHEDRGMMQLLKVDTNLTTSEHH